MLCPSSYIFACINLITYTLNTYRIGFVVSIELLSPVVISYHASIPSYMILSLTCVFVRVFGLPSLVI
jgi:hypothetical protein